MPHLEDALLEGESVKRLKVLMSAYACEPGKGSEPGVGWAVANEMSRFHDVWVLTRANNRTAIEQELTRRPNPNLRVAYYDLPAWARSWKRGTRGLQIYYYLWQYGAFFVARRLHRSIGFDVAHHVTIGRYWSPALVSLLGVPFVWGSVGGAETSPRALRQELSYRDRAFEHARDLAKWLGEHDPLVRATARRTSVALGATSQTARRLEGIGCGTVHVEPQVGMSAKQFSTLTASALAVTLDGQVRFASIGRPLHWKGFHLGLRAFSLVDLARSEYWLIANGPERAKLELLATRLGIRNRVRFLDRIPSLDDVYAVLGKIDVLIHPALHEAFGTVVLEAMAAGKPVICLDTGGPALQVTADTGFRIPVGEASKVVAGIADAMIRLGKDKQLRHTMGEAGRLRVLREFSWDRKAEVLDMYYREAASATK